MADTWSDVKLQFLTRGVLSAKELMGATKLSQSSISRCLAAASDSIVRIGRARASRYGLLAPIGKQGSRWPLYAIDEDGNPEQIGTLHALAGRAWYFERVNVDAWPTLTGEKFPDGVFPDIPWFLNDARPQGFLGRAFARAHGSFIGEGSNPIKWSSRRIAEALLQFGDDTPGAFVLGREALMAALTGEHQRSINASDRATEYPRNAEAALQGDVGGSLAGGEQPKFTAVIRQNGIDQHVIVKFSARLTNNEGGRWADLLAAEHLAATILGSNGFQSVASEIHDFSGRRFLEVRRFDRTQRGRVATVSLQALDSALFGELHTPWRAAADRLENAGWLDGAQAATLRTLWSFGELIGNTDMHYGNVSLFLRPNQPLKLTPVYDMLPMGFRPQLEGRLPDRLPEPSAEAWKDSQARAMATSFWRRLSNSPKISEGFRTIVREHCRHFERPVGQDIAIAAERGAGISVPARAQDGADLRRYN